MTAREFGEAEGWVPVGRFSNISATEDGQREFLERIPVFRAAEKAGLILPDGFPMPDIGSVIVGRIIGLDFVPDFPGREYSDGMVVVKHPRPAIPE